MSDSSTLDDYIRELSEALKHIKRAAAIIRHVRPVAELGKRAPFLALHFFQKTVRAMLIVGELEQSVRQHADRKTRRK